jgi:hypothetical protein
MATLTVEVHNGSEWVAVDADQAGVTKRHGRGGKAEFTIRPAAVADRELLQMERRVRIKLEKGEQTSWFLGIARIPRVIAVNALSFDLHVECTELAEKAVNKTPDTILEYPQVMEAITRTPLEATASVHIEEDNASTNFAGLTTMRTQNLLAGPQHRSLLKFDFSSISSDARILLARLFLSTAGGDIGTVQIFAHRLTQAWIEGEVTWNQRVTGFDWSDAGGTFVDDHFASIELPASSIQQRVNMDVTDYAREVRGVQASETDEGLILRLERGGSFLTAGTIRTFRTKDSANPLGQRPRLTVDHASPTLISAAVQHIWGELWPEVDTTQVQPSSEAEIGEDHFVPLTGLHPTDEATGEAEPRGIEFGPNDDLFEATYFFRDLLPGYEWWLDTTDGDNIILRFEQIDDSTVFIGESQIGVAYEMEPTNTKIVNILTITGERGGGEDADGVPNEKITIFHRALDNASRAIFDDQFGRMHDPQLDSVDLLRARAQQVLAERAFEFWRFSVSTEQMFIRPGRRVFYLGATVGIEPEGFGQVFIVDETRDTFDRGRWERTMTLKEFRL